MLLTCRACGASNWIRWDSVKLPVRNSIWTSSLKPLCSRIDRPGGKGIKNTARYVDRLSRKFEYQGAAWYQREVVIPEDWADREIYLKLERCHWETTVYVDDKEAGMKEHLSTPNTFVLTPLLTPGIHTLTICVNNTLKYPMDQWNHGTTEYTQTNWNGIAGDISLYAKEKAHIRQINVYPDVSSKAVEVSVQPAP